MITLLYELRDKYRELLIQYNKVVKYNPDKLIDNITPLIEQTENTIKLIFSMPKEWKAIEEGQKPHFPNPTDIERWVIQKPLVPYESKDGRIPSVKQLTYLVCNKIAKYGTEEFHLLERAINETDFINRALEILKEQYKKEQIKVLNEIFK